MYRCLIDMAAGMDSLHSLGVINGDLKPANVLLKSTNADSRGFVCKVRPQQGGLGCGGSCSWWAGACRARWATA